MAVGMERTPVAKMILRKMTVALTWMQVDKGCQWTGFGGEK